MLLLFYLNTSPLHARFFLTGSITYMDTLSLPSSSIQIWPHMITLRLLKETGSTYILEKMNTSLNSALLLWKNPSWYLLLSMHNSWLTWLWGYLKVVSLVFWTRLPYSGTPNDDLAFKLLPIVVNMPSLAYVLTRLLNFAILYATLVFPYIRSMDQMPYLCLAITCWLSILRSCLPISSMVGLTF